jgi:hypothetical protein
MAAASGCGPLPVAVRRGRASGARNSAAISFKRAVEVFVVCADKIVLLQNRRFLYSKELRVKMLLFFWQYQTFKQ